MINPFTVVNNKFHRTTGEIYTEICLFIDNCKPTNMEISKCDDKHEAENAICLLQSICPEEIAGSIWVLALLLFTFSRVLTQVCKQVNLNLYIPPNNFAFLERPQTTS